MVPAAPPRIIVPTDPTPLPAPEEMPAPTTPVRPRPQRPAATPRPDPRVEPPKPADAAADPNQDTQRAGGGPRRLLRRSRCSQATAETPASASSWGKAADRDLQKVNYAGLSNNLKARSDTAKRFITLSRAGAERASLIFAATLAEKAGAIADTAPAPLARRGPASCPRMWLARPGSARRAPPTARFH